MVFESLQPLFWVFLSKIFFNFKVILINCSNKDLLIFVTFFEKTLDWKFVKPGFTCFYREIPETV